MRGSVYWSTYKIIEQEIIDLSYSITFDDCQAGAYSNKILDLIVRICINIESLYKDICRAEFSKTETTIGKTASKVVDYFGLTSKMLYVRNENFCFCKILREIMPFDYNAKDENDFYSVHCELKHDRLKNARKANIRTMLLALGAFYILNVIYDDRITPIQNNVYGTEVPFDFSYNTNIFSSEVFNKSLHDIEEALFSIVLQYNGKLDSEPIDFQDVARQCEKNLNITFREQKQDECLFVTSISSNYMNKLREFEKKYLGDTIATRTELSLLLGDYYSPKTYEGLNEKSLDVLMEHIMMNFDKNIINIEVNRTRKHR